MRAVCESAVCIRPRSIYSLSVNVNQNLTKQYSAKWKIERVAVDVHVEAFPDVTVQKSVFA
jgi:hypothetical protein